VFRVNPDPGIFYHKVSRFTIIMPAHGDRTAFWRVFNRIGDQVAESTSNFHIGTNQITMTVNIQVQRMTIVHVIGLRIIK